MPLSVNPLLRARYVIFAGVLAIFLWGTVAVVRGFAVDNSVGVWFAQDDPALVEYREHLNEFGATEWTLLMVETDSLESAESWRELRGLTTALGEVDHVRRVVSLASLAGAEGRPAELLRQLERHPVARNLLSTAGGASRTVLLLETDNFLNRQDAYRQELVDAVHATVRRYPSITDHAVAGTSVINAELNRSALRDMFLFFTLVTLLVFSISLALFRSFRDAAVLLIGAAGTVVVTMGFVAAAGYSLNMVTIMLPTVLVSLSVADTIHLIFAFRERLARGSAPRPAAEEALRELAPRLVLTSVILMGGFGSMIASSFLPTANFGLFSSLTLLLALVADLLLLPLALRGWGQWRAGRALRRAPRRGGETGMRPFTTQEEDLT
ncbi:MAG: MMPL family transporter [Polyangiaceae bacterium]|nr:MMPL family transporter [Polyangiaceae bacterium]